MDVEDEDHVADAMQRYFENLANANGKEDPLLRKALEDAMEKDKKRDKETDRLKALTTPLRKKEKKAKVLREKVKGAHVSDDEESDEDHGPGHQAPIRVGHGNSPFNRVVLTSTMQKTYEDDTPVYEEEVVEMSSEEDEVCKMMQAVSLDMRQKDEDMITQEALNELREELDKMDKERLLHAGWCAAFIAMNTSDFLEKEQLSVFLDDYITRRFFSV